MSNTRRSATGEFNQERFCSSPEYETGLRAYEVAKRAQLLPAIERELVLALQAESHRPGGLTAALAAFFDFARKDIGTPLMFELAVHSGRTLKGNDVRRLRAELEGDVSTPHDEFGGLSGKRYSVPKNFYGGKFPLAGETKAFTVSQAVRQKRGEYYHDAERVKAHQDSGTYPDSYAGEVFIAYCIESIRPSLEEDLQRYCLDPATTFPKYKVFPKLQASLLEFLRGRGTEGFVETSIAKEIFKALGEARRASLTLIGGLEGRGKSTAAKEWCDQNSGCARYVRIPATSDDISFYRAIAKALGVSAALSLKGVQMRERIEYVLQTTKLMLVCDCAEYVWPQNNRREALPNRLNWLINALVEIGTPVALISNPQFDRDQRICEVKTGWSPALFLSLLTRRVLPSEMSGDDLAAVVQSCLPEASEAAVDAITEYALNSGKYSGGIDLVVKAARAIAESDDRCAVTSADVTRALKERIMPSDRAIAQAMHTHCKRAKRLSATQKDTLESDEQDRAAARAEMHRTGVRMEAEAEREIAQLERSRRQGFDIRVLETAPEVP